MSTYRAVAACMLCLFARVCLPQPVDVSKLTAAFERVQRTPADIKAQRAYLAVFPNSYASFISVFGCRQEGPRALCEQGENYTDALFAIGDRQPKETFAVVFRIERSARWEADTVNYLQNATTVLAKRHPAEFGHELERIAPEERKGVMKFLLDGPVPAKKAAFVEPITGELRVVGYENLGIEFEALVKATAVQPAWH